MIPYIFNRNLPHITQVAAIGLHFLSESVLDFFHSRAVRYRFSSTSHIAVYFNQSIVFIDEPGKGILPAERLEIHRPQITDKQAYPPKASESLQKPFRKMRTLFSVGYEFNLNKKRRNSRKITADSSKIIKF